MLKFLIKKVFVFCLTVNKLFFIFFSYKKYENSNLTKYNIELTPGLTI